MIDRTHGTNTRGDFTDGKTGSASPAPDSPSPGSGGAHASAVQPGPRGRSRRRWRNVLIAAIVVLVVALCVLAYIAFTYWNGQKSYDDLVDEALSVSEDGSLAIDWDALRAINPDVVGWMYVPGTDVNYPVAHRDDDDEYYLTHNFSDETSGTFGAEYGCIMLAGVNQADFSDTLNVIYGHNLSNGLMFAAFAKFHDSDEFNEHRTIYLFTPDLDYKLTSFALDRVEGTDLTIVIPNFDDEAQLEAYVQQRIDDSVVYADPAPPPASEVDKVFAFSTCDSADNSYRYITFSSPEGSAPDGSDEAKDLVEPGVAEDIVGSAKERI